MSVITQQKMNALPGRPYGSFRRPFFVPKLFVLVTTRVSIFILEV